MAVALAIGAPTPSRAQQAPAHPAAQSPPSTPVPAIASAPVSVPEIRFERYALPNGLEVILHEDHRTPTVSSNIWYHVGSKDEPMGRNGFAHLFEHLMFQGSRHVPEDTFFLNLERAGGSNINGTTGDDRTNYYETVPSGRLGLALWLESDRMAYLLDHVNQATLDSQRGVVLNEYRQNYENAPYGMVSRSIREAIFPVGHPYHRLPIGTPEDLNAATLEDVRAFFRTWYVPNNATLVVAGDFQPAAARQLIEQYFGPITRGRDVPRQPAPAVVSLARGSQIDMEASVELPRVYISWPTPSALQPGDAELDIVAAVLAEDHSSRLYRRLVHERQIAQDVEAGQQSQQLGSVFTIAATARTGHGPDELLAAIDAELALMRTTPVGEPEMARARTHYVTQIVFENERAYRRADRLNFYNQYTGDAGWLSHDVARYQNTTAAAIRETVVRYLVADRRNVVRVYPTPGAPVSGRVRASGGAQ